MWYATKQFLRTYVGDVVVSIVYYVKHLIVYLMTCFIFTLLPLNRKYSVTTLRSSLSAYFL